MIIRNNKVTVKITEEEEEVRLIKTLSLLPLLDHRTITHHRTHRDPIRVIHTSGNQDLRGVWMSQHL